MRARVAVQHQQVQNKRHQAPLRLLNKQSRLGREHSQEHLQSLCQPDGVQTQTPAHRPGAPEQVSAQEEAGVVSGHFEIWPRMALRVETKKMEVTTTEVRKTFSLVARGQVSMCKTQTAQDGEISPML